MARGITRAKVGTKPNGKPVFERRVGRLGIGKTNFFLNFVHHSDDDPNVPGTDVPRLKLLRLAVNAAAAFDDEIDALIEGLRRFRDRQGVRRARKADAAGEQWRSRCPLEGSGA